jgi:hypothetical protein
MPDTPAAGGAAPQPTVETVDGGQPQGLSAEDRAAAAAARRDGAQADYDASMTAAAAARQHAKTLTAEAAAIEKQAKADRDAALQHADQIEAGEG